MGKRFCHHILIYHDRVQEENRETELHLFGDASIIWTSADAYAFTKQTLSTTQGFTSSKSRLSKKNTYIPRSELTVTVMLENLAENIANSLQRFKVIAAHGWGDSMVVLYWHKGNSTYN